jgi:UDP-N-acetylmuramoyl-tripeptide--D-alanyl-D-alanine ligase
MFGKSDELKTAVQGRLTGAGNKRFDGISTDSRHIKKGEVFLAIKGERFDGHQFAKDVIKKGAAGVIVNKGWQGSISPKAFIIEVDDTRKALGAAACYWRRKTAPLVIGVTGSCGKTTTKELIHAVLSKKFAVLKNHGNLNNYFGVSQTLLKLREESFAVIEMGINNMMEMKELTDIAEPDAGIITNIAPVHLEGLKSLREVYGEKKILLDRSKKAGFINKDDRFLAGYMNKKLQMISFGKKGRVAYSALKVNDLAGIEFIITDKNEKKGAPHRFRFPYVGIGLSSNIAGAAAVGRYFGIGWEDIIAAVSSVRLPGLRMEILDRGGAKIIMDAYNANPASIKNALATLGCLEGRRKTVVLGDMKELGRWSGYYHRLIGQWLLKGGYSRICLVGSEIEETWKILKAAGLRNVSYHRSVEELRESFDGIEARSDIILVKGSRAIKLETLINGVHHAI